MSFRISKSYNKSVHYGSVSEKFCETVSVLINFCIDSETLHSRFSKMFLYNFISQFHVIYKQTTFIFSFVTASSFTPLTFSCEIDTFT